MHMNLLEQDEKFLRYAIEISRSCIPSTGAYSVGAVIVNLAGEMIATGYSRETDPKIHAEEVALLKLSPPSKALISCTLYSSLEPCSVRLSGRRSCCSRIIESGISRVVFAMNEPSNFVVCEGEAILRSAGIEVIKNQEFASLVQAVNAHLAPIVSETAQKN